MSRSRSTSVGALALPYDLHGDYREGTSSYRFEPAQRSHRPNHRFQAFAQRVLEHPPRPAAAGGTTVAPGRTLSACGRSTPGG